MIYCLSGEVIIADALTNTAVIDCAGVGYKVNATGSAISHLLSKGEGAKVRVFTYMAVREDAVQLYGFKTENELSTFKILISVSGVGPKAGLSILNTLSPEELAIAIAGGDTKSISRAPGIGKRTAERIILELKDKLAKGLPDASDTTGGVSVTTAAKGNLADARDALLVLGYTKAETDNALKGADKSMSTEDIIRFALAKLM